MKLTDLIKIGKETISVLYPEKEAGEMVFAYLEEAIGTKRHTHIIEPDYEVAPGKLEAILKDFNRMAAGEPLQYIIGKAWFYGRQFHVTPDVLIPRPETEILCNTVISRCGSVDTPRVLDMCTGSGCILLSLLHYSNDCVGTGVDISEKALEVAKENCKKLGLDASFLQSDLFTGVSGKYDIIVSNPPYIRSDVIPTLMEEVKGHEPMLALDGFEDGLYFYRKIVDTV